MLLQSLAPRVRRLDLELLHHVQKLRRGDDPVEIAEALDSARGDLTAILNDLITAASSLDGVDRVIADSMNNILMSIQTVCDRLRDRSVSSSVIREVSDQLRDTVANGRTAVSRIRQTIAGMP